MPEPFQLMCAPAGAPAFCTCSSSARNLNATNAGTINYYSYRQTSSISKRLCNVNTIGTHSTRNKQ